MNIRLVLTLSLLGLLIATLSILGVLQSGLETAATAGVAIVCSLIVATFHTQSERQEELSVKPWMLR